MHQADAPAAVHYAWRAEGPSDPQQVHRFDSEKILLDPFATEVTSLRTTPARRPAVRGRTTAARSLACCLRATDEQTCDRAPPPRHTHDTIVYELHVKGFTARANSGVSGEKRGTFLGVIEKIPHLQKLGVTVVELLPVHQFDPQEGNYWGYMTLNFFAPHRGYAVKEPVREFRQMVSALHAAGIEVWLDVVYNHTAEGDQGGPTYSLRGMDNSSYYLLSAGRAIPERQRCGNTTRCAHPAMRLLVLGSLRYWAERWEWTVFVSISPRSLPGTGMEMWIPISLRSGPRDRRGGGPIGCAPGRGGLGHRRLPAGAEFPGPEVAPVERRVSRRFAVVRPGRSGQGGRIDDPPLRQ